MFSKNVKCEIYWVLWTGVGSVSAGKKNDKQTLS